MRINEETLMLLIMVTPHLCTNRENMHVYCSLVHVSWVQYLIWIIYLFKQIHQWVIKDYRGQITEHISHSSCFSSGCDTQIFWCFASIRQTTQSREMCTAGQNFSVIHYFLVMASSGSRAWEFYLEWKGSPPLHFGSEAGVVQAMACQ